MSDSFLGMESITVIMELTMKVIESATDRLKAVHNKSMGGTGGGQAFLSPSCTSWCVCVYDVSSLDNV